MAQTIKIKRSTASAAPATIAAGELAYSKGSQTLYIGDPDTGNANTPLPIGPAIINNAGTVSRATGVTATELQQIMDTEVGVDVQAYDADLTTIGGLSKTNGNVIVGNGSTWTSSPLTTELAAISSNVTIGDATDVTVTTSGDLTVTGDLSVLGTLTTIETTEVRTEDNNIVLNYGTGDTSASANGGGITIQDAVDAATDASLSWVQASDLWNLSHGLQINGTTRINTAGKVTASDGTTLKPGITFSADTNTGIARTTENSGRINFISNGAVKAYVQTGTASPEVETMYVDGILDVSSKVTWSGGSSTLANTAADKRITSLAFNTTNGVFTVNTADNVDFTVDLDGRYLTDVAFSDIQAASVQTSAELVTPGFSNDDTSLMTAAAIDDLILSKNYGSGSGDITQVNITAGTGLSGSVNTTSGNHVQTLAVDLSELTDMTAAVDRTQDELIILDNGADRRKLISEIPLSAFKTSAGTDLEFENEFLTLNATSTVTNQNGGIRVERTGVNSDAVIYWNDAESKWYFGTEGLGNSIGVGDITQVAMTSTDGSVTFGGAASATGTVGDLSFDVEVDTIDGGTY